MRSRTQQIALKSLYRILLPLARLMLRCGLGCSEFVHVTKAAFVEAASVDYGLRGRPTNISRVAAMTGLSRKEVSRIRADALEERWTPDMEVTPANTVLHYWHFDPTYSDGVGVPKPLSFSGKASFTELVNTYAGDIPAGAMRTELIRAGTVADDDQKLVVRERYFFPSAFDADFVRNASFAIKNLAETLVHNAMLVSSQDPELIKSGRFERFAWSDRLSWESAAQFKQWVRHEGGRFVEVADQWIGQHEADPSDSSPSDRRTVGVGVYFFEED